MTLIRRLVQFSCLVVFAGVFLLATLTAPTWAPPANALFRLSPLDALVARVVRGHWLPVFAPALLVVVLTPIFGRFFCGWMCPTGALLDGAAHLVGAARRAPATRRIYWKYYVLAATLAASACGSGFAWFFDPAGIFFRFMMTLFPGVLLGWRVVVARHPNVAGWPLAPTADAVFVGSVGIVVFSLLLVLLEKVERRFWCRNLCPLGALLAILARCSLVRREIVEECNQCGACQRVCKMAASHPGPRDLAQGECVECLACTQPCAKKAVKFRFVRPDLAGAWRAVCRFLSWRPVKTEEVRAGMARRHFMLSVAGGAAYGVFARTEVHSKMPDARLLRPPNALPGAEFTDACIRCGTCMKVCVTNGLQPTMLESGLEGLWTPRLIPRIGFCDGPCDLCGNACPTGAIRPFVPEEKPKIRIGGAIIDRDRCIAWRDGQQCLVCDEHCFFKAVYWKEVDGLNRPFVDGAKCVGCGICENKCPTVPDPAIVVFNVPASTVAPAGSSGYPAGSLEAPLPQGESGGGRVQDSSSPREQNQGPEGPGDLR